MPKHKNIFDHYPYIKSKDRYRVRVKIDENAPPVPITGRTPDEIDAKYTAMVEAFDAGLVLNRETTLVQYAREWYQVKIAKVSLKSGKMYENAINKHIAPFFKNLKLSEVRPLNIEKFMAGKASLSKSSQSKLLITLNQVFTSAELNGLILKNPCRGITAGGRAAQPKTPLTKEQQKQLVTAVTDECTKLFILLGLYAGLRKEEALGLLWSNVHLEDVPYIDVRHAVTFDNDRPTHTDQLKSKSAYRSIPIPPVLADELAKAKANPQSLFVIHPKRSNGVMSNSAFRRMWDTVVGYSFPTGKKDDKGKTIKKSVKGLVDFHVTPHILRHTYLTELCASGMDIKKIQYLAGHQDVSMTLRIYTHVTNNTPKELYNVIYNAFTENVSTSKKGSIEGSATNAND